MMQNDAYSLGAANTNYPHPASGRVTTVICLESGAAEGTRTPDPIITNDVLYQLSYSGPGEAGL